MLGGVSFDSTLATVLLPGHFSCHTGTVAALGRYVTTVPTVPVWHSGPGADTHNNTPCMHAWWAYVVNSSDLEGVNKN